MNNNILLKMSCLTVLMALSQILYAQGSTAGTGANTALEGYDREVRMTFSNTTARKVTGSVITIDVEEELQKDQNSTLAEMIYGKVPGMFGSYNIWGTGNAVLLVDGIRQDGFYINSLNPMEVESVIILKDALSKTLYGAQGDKGVILITTKRGIAGQHKLRISGQYRSETPRALPKYLNAADYMKKYNEAQLNDGTDPSSLRYSQQVIDATISGENPARYPDNDFFSDTYIKDNTAATNIFADVLGGDNNARYYVNTGWSRSNGWLNTPQGDVTNNLNFRGNLDFLINEYMNMSLNATGRLSFNMQPNTSSIWATGSTELPNNYPVLWDPNLISNTVFRDFLLSKANLENGQLLGGNTSFLNNVYGGFTQNGKQKFMQRNVQFGGKLNLDMRFITEGLSANFYGGMNFYNTLFASQSPTFAVYEPVFDETTGLLDTVFVHGVDKAANQFNTSDSNSDFFRQVTYYSTLNYNRSFGVHDISATGLFFNDLITYRNNLYKDVVYHTGIAANYMYSGKYVAEVSLMGIGSKKLKEGSRIELTPALGIGWVMSEEDFMSDLSFVDYVKVRSSLGVSRNDNWSSYYLYKSTFTRGSTFTYQNGVSANAETVFASVPNNIWLQKRRDFTVGLDATLFEKSVNVSLGYFNSASLDNITLMSSTYPQILGYENLVYSNYNSDLTRGIEMGINYRFELSRDFTVTAGSNLLYISPKITKLEEPAYEGADKDLTRTGTATDALWALVSDGLYSESDFNPDGSLAAGLPVPTFGAVKPGDIKYLDQNGDNIIDQKDQRIIGHGLRTQYSLYLDMKYKKLQFYILGIGQAGDYNYRSGSYYRVFGNVKYSEMVNEAYGPGNRNVNAKHPRLSATDASNNNRNSDYWIYRNNTFAIPTMQLTYHFSGTQSLSFLNDSRIYVRADNALIFGENKKYSEVSIGQAPKTSSLSIGLVTSF